jgi:NADPH:quinone reductase-like Zn-dependent oxidoreductase
MRALWLTKTGGISAFELRETPDPVPGPGQIRIRVRAIGLNFADLLASQGLYPGAPQPPCVLGYEAAGAVDVVGDGVDSGWIGKRVAALTNFGAHADVVCASAQQSFELPAAMTFEEGAALPVQWLTAYHMLFDVAHVRAGESVLVHMAAGGVGTAVLQLCRSVGSLVTFGTASAVKHPVLLRYGCTHPIDYRTIDYAEEIRRLTAGEGVDVILDPLGGDDWRKGYDLLKPGGRLICYGFANVLHGEKRNWLRALGQLRRVPRFNPLDMMRKNKSVAGVHLGTRLGSTQLFAENMREILTLYQSGAVKPLIDAVVPLADAHTAFRRIQKGKNAGKVILAP